MQIDKSVIKQYGIKVSEYFFMMILMYYPGTTISLDISSLLDNGFIMELDDGYYITDDGLAFINEVEITSMNKNISNKDIVSLAEEMKLIFPEGKKPGTNKYWRDNKANVEAKLKSFFKKYGHYDFELIKNATQKYVDSYSNNNQLMRILPYFILKDDSSELLTTIENFDNIGADSNNDMWASVLK